LERLKQSHDVDIVWRSFELRPKGSPPMPPQYLAKIEATRPRLHKMAREQYGLELNPGPMGLSSRDALIGMKYTEAQGKGAEYHDAVFRAYWQHAQRINDRLILGDIAQSIGLDRQAFLSALDNEDFEREVDEDIEQAYQYGLNGVPALVFAGKYLISGAQPYDVLRQVVEKIEAENGSP
jgi:predicted DsbA family dithiol-disulfide isomerase